MYKSSEKVSVITERIRLKAHNGFFISLNQNAERGVFISWDVVPKHARSYKDTPFLDSHCMESSLFIIGADGIGNVLVLIVILVDTSQSVEKAADELKVLWKTKEASPVQSEIEGFEYIHFTLVVGFIRRGHFYFIQHAFRSGYLLWSKSFVNISNDNRNLISVEFTFFIICEGAYILGRALYREEKCFREKTVEVLIYPNHVKQSCTVILVQLEFTGIQQVLQTIDSLIKILEAESLKASLQFDKRAFQQCCDNIFIHLLLPTYIVSRHRLADRHFNALIISLAKKQEIDRVVLFQSEPLFDNRLIEDWKAPR